MSGTIEFEDDNVCEEYLKLVNEKTRRAVKWELRSLVEDADGVTNESEWDHINDEYFNSDISEINKFWLWGESRGYTFRFLPTDKSYQEELENVVSSIVGKVLGEGQIMEEDRLEEFINEALTFENFELDWVLTVDGKERDVEGFINFYREEVSEI